MRLFVFFLVTFATFNSYADRLCISLYEKNDYESITYENQVVEFSFGDYPTIYSNAEVYRFTPELILDDPSPLFEKPSLSITAERFMDEDGEVTYSIYAQSQNQYEIILFSEVQGIKDLNAISPFKLWGEVMGVLLKLEVSAADNCENHRPNF